MKPNIMGIVGGILAFVSLALPWWIMSMTGIISYSITVYPYTTSVTGSEFNLGLSLWYSWVVLALVAIAGLLGTVGSLKNNKLLIVSGVLALFSNIIFALGLRLDFLNLASAPNLLDGTAIFGADSQALVLFGSGSIAGVENYYAFLSFGFWIALIAAILMLVSSRKKTVSLAPQPPPPPPPGPIMLRHGTFT